MENNKLYIIDTSVLIHDPEALRNFDGADVALPIFVIMELDDLKASPRTEVASAARTASRRISALMELGSLHEGSGVINPVTGGRVSVVGGKEFGLESLRTASGNRKMDLLILEAATAASKRFAGKTVTLVTKDVNLRILADSLGLRAEDYKSDRVRPNDVPVGYRTVHVSSLEELAPLYERRGEDASAPLPFGLEGLNANEFVAFKEPAGGSQLFRYRGNSLRPVQGHWKGMAIKPRNLEQRMALELLMDPNVTLVTLLGAAGTGKTLCALAAAVQQLDTHYDRIILSKAVVPMGRDLGYLPGSEAEKMHPWVLSYYDNLDQLFPQDNDVKGRKGSTEKNYEQLIHSGRIQIQPLHSVRGRSIARSLFIVDEVQNLSPHEIRTVVSRAATGTKMVLCGDPSQIDDAYLDAQTNGLVHVAEAAAGSAIAGTVTLQESVRSPLAELAATLL